jgi:hypothetical protein
MSISKDVAKREQKTREIFSQLPRRVEPGCIVKVETRKMFVSDCDIAIYVPYLYGIVKHGIDYCHSTTAVGYQVIFAFEHIIFAFNAWVLSEPVFDSDMVILCFQDDSTSIEDANVNKLFTKVAGRWYKKSKTQTNNF